MREFLRVTCKTMFTHCMAVFNLQIVSESRESVRSAEIHIFSCIQQARKNNLCVWMKHFNNVEKLKYILFELFIFNSLHFLNNLFG